MAFKPLFLSWLSALTWTASALSSAAELPYYNSADFTPRWLEFQDPQRVDFHRVPPFLLTNQLGESVTEKAMDGRVSVVSFFFSTCPGLCPALKSKLAAVQEHFKDTDGVIIYSHSIRPSTDSIDVLQRYGERNGVQAGRWHLLTGDREALYTLAKGAYFASEDLGEAASIDEFLHSENLLLVDQNRQIRGIYNGLSAASVRNLITDIELLKEQPPEPLPSRLDSAEPPAGARNASNANPALRPAAGGLHQDATRTRRADAALH